MIGGESGNFLFCFSRAARTLLFASDLGGAALFGEWIGYPLTKVIGPIGPIFRLNVPGGVGVVVTGLLGRKRGSGVRICDLSGERRLRGLRY